MQTGEMLTLIPDTHIVIIGSCMFLFTHNGFLNLIRLIPQHIYVQVWIVSFCVIRILLHYLLLPLPAWAEGTVLCLFVCVCVCYHKIGV